MCFMLCFMLLYTRIKLRKKVTDIMEIKYVASVWKSKKLIAEHCPVYHDIGSSATIFLFFFFLFSSIKHYDVHHILVYMIYGDGIHCAPRTYLLPVTYRQRMSASIL